MYLYSFAVGVVSLADEGSGGEGGGSTPHHRALATDARSCTPAIESSSASQPPVRSRSTTPSAVKKNMHD